MSICVRLIRTFTLSLSIAVFIMGMMKKSFINLHHIQQSLLIHFMRNAKHLQIAFTYEGVRCLFMYGILRRLYARSSILYAAGAS